ncbi:serine aminopeptidase domain-containing protein [Gordonia sp. (in: high G+C Gram-positive bacteria)]|uniref:serine aminopeptidase domain-containing protein n=1 Tax=Gordonia sp. (in: high G+C Gram-positive bacteria) TaxID=84139 RepID=UPI0035B2B31F
MTAIVPLHTPFARSTNRSVRTRIPNRYGGTIVDVASKGPAHMLIAGLSGLLSPGRRSPSLLVLVLPGGTDNSHKPFSPCQPSALRMYPFTWSLRLRFGRSVRVHQVGYRVYGWNGDDNSPLLPARAALDEICRRHPGVPVVAIGHSMGGRVAAHLAADRRVIGVLGLAPWWQFADWRHIQPGARVVAVHGDADTRTLAKRTRKGIAELSALGVDAEFIPVPGGGHAMLDHIGLWQRSALDFVGERLSALRGA